MGNGIDDIIKKMAGQVLAEFDPDTQKAFHCTYKLKKKERSTISQPHRIRFNTGHRRWRCIEYYEVQNKT
jgi:hypothetical protein